MSSTSKRRKPHRNIHQAARRAASGAGLATSDPAYAAIESKAVELSRIGLGIKLISKALCVSTRFVTRARERIGMPTCAGKGKEGVRLNRLPDHVRAAVQSASEEAKSILGNAASLKSDKAAEAIILSEYIKDRLSDCKMEEMWCRHKEYALWRTRKWVNSEYRSNPAYKTTALARRRIHGAIKRQSTSKHSSSAALLGCSGKEASAWIESQFKRGMSWENHGKWEIDHVIPCASFDLTDPKQQKMCFHFTNLQPLWKRENSAKGATIPANAQLPLCM